MPGVPLKNPRWEKFCQLYVQGDTAGSAAASYRAAGFRAGTWLHTNASKLLNKPAVRARIAELQRDIVHIEETAMKTAIERLALRKEAVLGELAKIGFANLLDYVRTDEHGKLVIDLAAIERDKGAALLELQMTETGEGPDRKQSVRIRVGEKLAALAHLGKHLGLFTERKDEAHEHLRQLTKDDIERRMADIDRQLADIGYSGAASSGEAQDEGRALPPPPKDET